MTESITTQGKGPASPLFSSEGLDVFRRPGAEVGLPPHGRSGCKVRFPSGWALSIQWGAGTYSTNRDAPLKIPPLDVPDAREAEIAVFDPTGEMIRWPDGEQVQGWCSMARVQHVLDLMAEDKLVVAAVAVDNWQEPQGD